MVDLENLAKFFKLVHYIYTTYLNNQPCSFVFYYWYFSLDLKIPL